MKLTLNRSIFAEFDTEGEVSIDSVFECYSLELPNVDGKPGSCISPGIYDVRLQPSPKFLRNPDPWVQQFANRMPHILDIPGRSLIMFHWGNFVENTDGCVLVGRTRGPNEVEQSRAAFETFFYKIGAAAEAGECQVEVIGGAIYTGV